MLNSELSMLYSSYSYHQASGLSERFHRGGAKRQLPWKNCDKDSMILLCLRQNSRKSRIWHSIHYYAYQFYHRDSRIDMEHLACRAQL